MKYIAYSIFLSILIGTAFLGMFVSILYFISFIGAFMLCVYWLKLRLDLTQAGKTEGSWHDYFVKQWDDFAMAIGVPPVLTGLLIYTVGSDTYLIAGFDVMIGVSFSIGVIGSLLIEKAFVRRGEVVNKILDKGIDKID